MWKGHIEVGGTALDSRFLFAHEREINGLTRDVGRTNLIQLMLYIYVGEKNCITQILLNCKAKYIEERGELILNPFRG